MTYIMRILCLDIGTKRIGIAASDPFGWTAQGLKVIERQNNEKTFEEIFNLCSELKVEKIVVGIALDENSEIGPAAKKVKAFADNLEKYLKEKKYNVPLEFWDERYSTKEAEERLIEADVSRKKRKRVIDKMAAVVILEDYLKSHD